LFSKRFNIFKDVNVEKSCTVPLILLLPRLNVFNEYLAHHDRWEIIFGSSSLKLL